MSYTVYTQTPQGIHALSTHATHEEARKWADAHGHSHETNAVIVNNACIECDEVYEVGEPLPIHGEREQRLLTIMKDEENWIFFWKGDSSAKTGYATHQEARAAALRDGFTRWPDLTGPYAVQWLAYSSEEKA
jgi:hypothetical protein